MEKIIFIALAVFCFQHILRDTLQDMGVKDWYTTWGHAEFKFIPDKPLYNHIGMVVFFALGCVFLYLALNPRGV